MREILFRGKRVSGNEWIEGSLCTTIPSEVDYYTISYFDNEGYYVEEKVIPETVGQYTGLTDKNGKKIFEGDVVSNEWCYMSGNSIVKFGEYQTSDMSKDYQQGHFGFYLEHIENDFVRKDMMYFANKCEVIGNIHDNPELLGGVSVTCDFLLKGINSENANIGEDNVFNSDASAVRNDNMFLFNGDKVFIEAVIQQNAKLIVDIEALKMQKSQMVQTIKGLEAQIAEGTKVANEELQESCEAMALEYEKMQAELLIAKRDIEFLMSGGNPCEVCAKTCKMGEECNPVWEGVSNEHTTKRT